MPPRVLPVVRSVLALVQMFLALRSRASSLMPLTSRYRRKISQAHLLQRVALVRLSTQSRNSVEKHALRR